MDVQGEPVHLERALEVGDLLLVGALRAAAQEEEPGEQVLLSPGITIILGFRLAWPAMRYSDILDLIHFPTPPARKLQSGKRVICQDERGSRQVAEP